MKMTNALEYKIHEIIARIKELRSIEGMTEADMAARLGMDEESYRAYERGEEDLNFGFLYSCAQVFSVVYSLDTRIYGKSKALDGNRHHVSFIIYWKHIAIAIDGETVHSTDMKLGEKFYDGFAGIQVGDFALEDLFIYEPDSRILNASEKDWTRLQAWLMAYYEMQK